MRVKFGQYLMELRRIKCANFGQSLYTLLYLLHRDAISALFAANRTQATALRLRENGRLLYLDVVIITCMVPIRETSLPPGIATSLTANRLQCLWPWREGRGRQADADRACPAALETAEAS